MQATLIYNAHAGSANDTKPDELQELLFAAGYHPVYKATDSETDLHAALKSAKGLIVVAGGDGTIRAAALHLIRRRGVTLAVLPLGTANNIGHTFGLKGFSVPQIIAGLPAGVSQPFDVGRIRGLPGTEYFLESFGCGVFADLLARYDPEAGKSITRAAKALLQVLPSYEPHKLRAWLDGKYLTGHFLLLEVLNTARTGPRLTFAPDADPSDGLLDVVGVLDSQRHGLLEYAQKLLREELGDMPNVLTRRCRRLRLRWDGFPLHLDADVRVQTTDLPLPAQPLTIDVLPGALTIRVPAGAAEQQRSAKPEVVPTDGRL